MFALQILNDGEVRFLTFGTGINRQVRTFDTGNAAANAAKGLNDYYKSRNWQKRVRVIRYSAYTDDNIGDDSWKDRERARFESGEYKPVPWGGALWYMQSKYFDEHFAHISVDNPGKIAFTESPEKGREDRQLRIRAGRYLTQYFGSILPVDTIRDLATQVSLETGEFELKLAVTPEEIEYVYLNGPHSCMAYQTNRFKSDEHPASVYGAGDLAVAYLQDGDSVPCRVVCWPDKSTYGRIYGDGGKFSEKLAEMLENQGFDDRGDFNGARLLRIPQGDSQFVCPYLDDYEYVEDNGNYLIITESSDGHYAQQTDGLCGALNTCDHCEDSYNPENGGGPVGNENLCRYCYETYAHYCDDCDGVFPGESVQHVDSVRRWICDSCIGDYPQCGECENRFPIGEMFKTNEHEDVCQGCLDELYTFCEPCDEYYRDGGSGDVQRVDSDELLCVECRGESYQKCIECDEYFHNNNLEPAPDGSAYCKNCLPEDEANEDNEDIAA